MAVAEESWLGKERPIPLSCDLELGEGEAGCTLPSSNFAELETTFELLQPMFCYTWKSQ